MVRLDGKASLVIAEIAQAHDGSLGTAHAYIDAVADAGAHAVKFQTHIATAESTPREPWRVPFSRQDASRYDYWRRMEFSEEQWAGLRSHARDRDLHFLSSAFSMEAVALLERVGVDAWKVASGEVTNLHMIERMAEGGLPVLLSSGMSYLDELDRAAAIVRAAGAPLAVFQCTSAYPTPPEQVGLNALALLRERFACPVGLSDHSGTVFPALAALTLGASLIEVHVTFDRRCFGPDVVASLTLDELATLVEGARWIDTMLSNPIDKDEAAATLADVRAMFTKSLVATEDLPAGTALRPEHLAAKKPGGGLDPSRLAELTGRTLTRDLARDQALAEEDLEA